MATYTLAFEKPILELDAKIRELREFSESQNIDVSRELMELEKKLHETRCNVYANLTPWDEVQLARHPQRPYTLDYVKDIFTDFLELHGDRQFADDRAVIGGWARLGDDPVMILGTQKGRDVKTNVEHNFGMACPEGYRKALRLMRLASKFKRPILTFIDTAGAYPGVGGEERHIAEAIAVNLREAMLLPVPIVVTVIGEGGSGGALGIGVGDKILILEHSYYSVISPEGCAAILWKDRAFASKAAEALKLTSKDLLRFGIVDEIVPEPLGGAHTDRATMSATLKSALLRNLDELKKMNPTALLDGRYAKFRAMGVFQSCPENLKPETKEEETEETEETEENKSAPNQDST